MCYKPELAKNLKATLLMQKMTLYNPLSTTIFNISEYLNDVDVLMKLVRTHVILIHNSPTLSN